MTVQVTGDDVSGLGGAALQRSAVAGRSLEQSFWTSARASLVGAEIAQQWLDHLCEQIRDIRTCFVVLKGADGAFLPAASKPIDVEDRNYLRLLTEQSLVSRTTLVVKPPHANRHGGHVTLVVANPMIAEGQCFGAVVLLLGDVPASAMAHVRQQLDIAVGWLHAARLADLRAEAATVVTRSQAVLRSLAVVEEHLELEAAAMQLAAHLEAELGCERASVGLADEKDRIEIVALSHSGGFDKKSEEARRVQAAMEEAFDQDMTVVCPGGAVSTLSLAHRAFGPESASASVVLRGSAGKAGVITVQRSGARPFDESSVALLELIGSLVAPALVTRRAQRAWFSGRAIDALTSFRSRLVGPRRPTLKLITAGVGLVALIALFANGQHRVGADAVVEGLVQRAASAPFDGFIETSVVRAGAVVRRGDVLATLDQRDLRLERTRWLGERQQRLKQYNDALAKHDRAMAGVLAAQVDQAESQLALAEENLARAEITAPIDGLVVSGDLSQLIGSPVEKGKVLFEIAPLESYRVILNVDESDIAHLQEGQSGQLAIAGVVGLRADFTVRNITSVTTTEDGKNRFRVEADLLDGSPQVRPGMEGIGKVAIGERRLVWIWTHRFFDWLRLQLWTWVP